MLIESPHYKPKQIINYNDWCTENLIGDLDDKVAQVTLAKFLYNNLGFTVDLMTGGSVVLYKHQKLILSAWFQRMFNMNVWGRGCSKTTEYQRDTLLLEKEKGLIPLTELIPNLKFDNEGWRDIPKINLWNGHDFKPISKIYVQPKKKCLRITTSQGYRLTGSINHLIKTIDKDCNISENAKYEHYFFPGSHLGFLTSQEYLKQIL